MSYLAPQEILKTCYNGCVSGYFIKFCTKISHLHVAYRNKNIIDAPMLRLFGDMLPLRKF